jgi:hypothetical protein
VPALPVVPGVLAVLLSYDDAFPVNSLNRLHFSYTGTEPSVANANSIAAHVGSEWASNLASLHSSNDVRLETVEVIDLTSATAATGLAAPSAAGTRTGASLPAGTAALVNAEIARRYRGGRPRSYLPAGVAADEAGGLWLSSFTTALATGWNAFIASINSYSVGGCSIGSPVNVSYYHGFTVVTSPTTGRARNVPTPRSTPTVDVITGYNFPNRIASQRRRNRA